MESFAYTDDEHGGWTIGLRAKRRPGRIKRSFLVGVRWHDKRTDEYYHPAIGLTVEVSLSWQIVLHLWWKEIQLFTHYWW